MAYHKAILAGGCFWCTEAIFRRLRGVTSVMPGYTGGTLANPAYEDVCTGTTGHAEAIEIEYDSELISYSRLLDVFFAIHNPTTLNRQGNDTGTQYRSAIFYRNETEKSEAIRKLNELASEYEDKIVTEIVPFTRFYPAENYHKDYFENNREAPYCSIVIAPKLRKLMAEYGHDVREEYKT